MRSVLSLATFMIVSIAGLLAATPTQASLEECQRLLTVSRAKETLPSSWKEYSEAFKKRQMNLVVLNGPILRSYRKKPDPFMDLLKQAGFRYWFFQPAELEPIIEHFAKAMSEHVRIGRIGAEDVLFPVRLYATANGDRVPVFFGNEPPRGLKPASEILSDRHFLELVRDGYFPMGENELIARIEQTMALHDIAHLVGFIQSPEYMAALRKGAAEYLREAKFDNNGKLNRVDYQRVFQVFETMSLVPAENRQALLTALWLPPSHTDRFAVSEVAQHLEQFSPRQLHRHQKNLKKLLPSLVRHYGGSANDTIIREHAELFDRPLSLSHFQDALFTEIHRGLKRSDTPESKKELAYRIARLQVALVESTHLTPQEWISAAMRAEVSEDSALYRYICKSGVWFKSDLIYAAHCR